MVRKEAFVVFAIGLMSIFSFNIVSAANKEFVIIEKKVTATLREAPNGTSSLGKIPSGTKIQIISKKEVPSGPLLVVWYEVKFKGKIGWISQYNTTGDIIKEDGEGNKHSVKEQGTDKVRFKPFDEQAKNDFKAWALKNTAVTSLEYPMGSDQMIWVKLKHEKYTTKDNVESIASNLARYYKMQTGYKNHVIVTVWHPFKDEWVAKGSF